MDMDTGQQQFDQAYWASQPPEVQALPGIADQDQRATQAAQLATDGFTIDVPDHGVGLGCVPGDDDARPIRLYLGAVGLAAAGDYRARRRAARRCGVRSAASARRAPSKSPPTSRTIRRSLPRSQPTPQTPAGDDPVGLQSIGNIYLSVPGETYQDGAEFTDTRGTFQKHVVVTPFGAERLLGEDRARTVAQPVAKRLLR